MIHTLVLLGNPGKEYETTRHNAARLVFKKIDNELACIDTCEVFIPDTYMNESGKALSEYLRYHDGRELVVLYDDKDLPLGTIRISYDRSDGGHNGVKSIIESVGTQAFTRLRIGIAPQDEEGKTVLYQGERVQSFVMGRFTESEMEKLHEVSGKVLNAVKDIISLGYQKAMEKHN